MTERYLETTGAVDRDDPTVRLKADELCRGAEDRREKAVRIFLFARDGIRYDPFVPFFLPEHYHAGVVMRRGRGHCVQKAVVLAALARAAGIPARLGFADIRNHLASKHFQEILGGNLFIYHGYAELLLEDRWVRATPAFDAPLCTSMGCPPVEFDGRHDAVFAPRSADGRMFVEYVRYHGSFADVPLERMLHAIEEGYGTDRVTAWKNAFP